MVPPDGTARKPARIESGTLKLRAEYDSARRELQETQRKLELARKKTGELQALLDSRDDKVKEMLRYEIERVKETETCNAMVAGFATQTIANAAAQNDSSVPPMPPIKLREYESSQWAKGLLGQK